MNKKSFLLLICLLLTPVSFAGEKTQSQPKIALVLGGGGARGAAHIGVLEVLEKERIKISCIVGTSMGALVSGAYAAGLSPQQMQDKIGELNWDDMFQDEPAYSEVNPRRKNKLRNYITGFEIGTDENNKQYQGGVVAGQKIKLFFNRLVGSDKKESRIESLSIPLSIIATDIGTGDRVVLREGSLTQAMRASMSVPGIMAPVRHGERLLVDGGLVDNVPISEARERCNPDIVIAVNVGSPLLKAEEVGSLLSVTIQMVNILTEQNVQRSLASLNAKDIYIKPDLEGISAADFQKNKEAVSRGKKAAEAVIDQLKKISVGEDEYNQWVENKKNHHQDSIRIDQIEVAKLKNISPDAVLRHIKIRPGESIDEPQLEKDIQRIYADGWYENVDYSLLSTRDKNILQVIPVEKPWGPDYLRFGVSLDSNFKNTSHYSLRAAYDKTWLNELGGQFLLTGEIGKTHSLTANLYQPLDLQQTYFIESTLRAARSNLEVFDMNEKLIQYDTSNKYIELGAGINIGTKGQIQGGWRKQWIDASTHSISSSNAYPDQANLSNTGVYGRIDIDQMDRLYFPTSGYASKIDYFKPSTGDYTKLVADLRLAYSIQDWAVNTKAMYYGSIKGELPIYNSSSLGGFLNVTAADPRKINGDDIYYGQLRVERIIGRMPLGLRGDMRGGIAFETAKISKPYNDAQYKGQINSATLFLGGETPIGLMFLGYGKTNKGDSSVYLFIGTP